MKHIFEVFKPGGRKEELCKIKRITDFFRPVKLPERLKSRNEEIILHIGDIPSWGYPYIKRMIRILKPEILVHTGDLIDDLKAGRKEEHVPKYKKKAPGIIRFFEKYANEVYLVPGNNDIADYLEMISEKAKIIPANTVVNIRDISCLLCHWVAKIDGEAEFYLYGHGPTGDEHRFYKPEDGKIYCNAFFGPAIIFPKDKNYIEIKNYNGELHI